MNINYKKLFLIKNDFNGIERGFRLLNSILNMLKNENSKVNGNIIKIYDYLEDKYFEVKMDSNDLINKIQIIYLDFWVKELIIESKWFSDFNDHIIFFLKNDYDNVLIEGIIRVLLESFILISNIENKINFLNFKKLLKTQFFLRCREKNDEIEKKVEYFVDSIIDTLIKKNF